MRIEPSCKHTSMKTLNYRSSINASSRFLGIAVFLAFVFFGCNQGNQEETTPPAELRTRYTFSQEKPIDFSVASGTYQVLYDYSVPIDTLFTYSGAFECGKDSLIYAQVRRTKADFEDEGFDLDPDFYLGEVTDLILYNGNTQRILNPPGFDPYFSAFCVHDDLLFYWGFSEHYELCAYRFNVNTKKTRRVRLGDIPETDFFGYVNPPVVFKNNTVAFKTDAGKKWVFDLNLKEAEPRAKQPTFLSPNK